MLLPAHHRLGAFAESALQIAANPVELLFGNQRAHGGVGIEARPEFDLPGLVGNAADYFVEHALLDIEARPGAAALSVIEEDRARSARNRGRDIGIGKNDVGRLASQL